MVNLACKNPFRSDGVSEGSCKEGCNGCVIFLHLHGEFKKVQGVHIFSNLSYVNFLVVQVKILSKVQIYDDLA